MKKILFSFLTIGAVLALVGGATYAVFTDVETSTGNTFTAGTIDIAVNGENPWTSSAEYQLADMKPSYTDYIDFTINNVGTNPADVWKTLDNVLTNEGTQSEPECVAQSATWNDSTKQCESGTSVHNIDSVIGYDLSIRVYAGANGAGNELQYQRLYNDDVMISAIEDIPMYLGMIPEGGSMKVHQSYHMITDAGNEYQGDRMTFDIVLDAKQLLGGTRGASMVLEDKSGDPDWDINQASTPKGTLSYTAMSPKFDFSFTGVAPLAGTNYSLVAYLEPNSVPAASGWPRTVIVLGAGASDGSGNITISSGTPLELNSNLTNMKIWLVKTNDLTGSTLSGWTGDKYLFETGLIEYRDTDL